jgi:hypothetical protein
MAVNKNLVNVKVMDDLVIMVNIVKYIKLKKNVQLMVIVVGKVVNVL